MMEHTTYTNRPEAEPSSIFTVESRAVGAMIVGTMIVGAAVGGMIALT